MPKPVPPVIARVRFPKQHYDVIKEKASRAGITISDLCRYATYRAIGIEENETESIIAIAKVLEELDPPIPTPDPPVTPPRTASPPPPAAPAPPGRSPTG